MRVEAELPVQETVVAPEQAQQVVEQTVAAPTHASRVDDVLRQGGEAARKYKLTGELPEPKSDVPADSSTADVQPESSTAATDAAATAATEQQQKPKNRDENVRNLREKSTAQEREIIALKAKLEVFERQSAVSRPSAPTTTETTPQADATENARPEFPDVEAFDDPKKYQAAVKEWQKADTVWVQKQFDKRITTEKKTETTQKAATQWKERIESAKKEFPDFEAVAFNDKTLVSDAMVKVIQTAENGHLIAYALGKNPAEAERIFKLTNLAEGATPLEIAEAVGIVKAEFSRIDLASLKKGPKAAPQVKPLKEVIASAPRPSAEVDVEGGASPVADPVEQALKDSKNSPAAFARWKKLQNEKDLAERKGARR